MNGDGSPADSLELRSTGKDALDMNAKIQTFFSTPQGQRWFLGALLLLFMAVSVQYTIKITCSERDNRSAFLRWREQILDLEKGINIYDEHNYPNPPIMAMMLEPLAEMPPVVGSLLWFYLKVGMLFLVFHWVFKIIEEPEKPFPFWTKALAITLSIRPLLGDLTHGNVNIFILFLVVGALFAFRQKREWIAGIVLALAIACKVTPALFLPYFLWKRSWKTLSGTAIGLCLFLVVVPGMYLGLKHNTFLLGQWYEQMIVPYVLEGEVTTEHQNQSLPGFLYRLLTPGASFSSWEGERYVPVEYHNIAEVPAEVMRIIVKCFLLTFVGLMVWIGRTNPEKGPRWKLAAEFSLIVLGMLLFSERTWKHHYVTLILPFTVILYYLAVCQCSRARWRFALGSLITAIVIIMTTSTGISDDLDRFGKLAQVYGAYMWANLILMGALMVILRTPDHTGAKANEDFDLVAFRVQFSQLLGQKSAVENRGDTLEPHLRQTNPNLSTGFSK